MIVFNQIFFHFLEIIFFRNLETFLEKIQNLKISKKKLEDFRYQIFFGFDMRKSRVNIPESGYPPRLTDSVYQQSSGPNTHQTKLSLSEMHTLKDNIAQKYSTKKITIFFLNRESILGIKLLH